MFARLRGGVRGGASKRAEGFEEGGGRRTSFSLGRLLFSRGRGNHSEPVLRGRRHRQAAVSCLGRSEGRGAGGWVRLPSLLTTP